MQNLNMTKMSIQENLYQTLLFYMIDFMTSKQYYQNRFSKSRFVNIDLCSKNVLFFISLLYNHKVVSKNVQNGSYVLRTSLITWTGRSLNKECSVLDESESCVCFLEVDLDLQYFGACLPKMQQTLCLEVIRRLTDVKIMYCT